MAIARAQFFSTAGRGAPRGRWWNADGFMAMDRVIPVAAARGFWGRENGGSLRAVLPRHQDNGTSETIARLMSDS
jgi:hypothetical protein